MSDGDPIADRVEALARLNRRQQPEWTQLEPGECPLCGRKVWSQPVTPASWSCLDRVIAALDAMVRDRSTSA